MVQFQAEVRLPAGPAQVTTSGTMPDGSPLKCPICGVRVYTLYGSMYGDRTLTCGTCFDDRFFAEHQEAREQAEEHQRQVVRWMTGQ